MELERYSPGSREKSDDSDRALARPASAHLNQDENLQYARRLANFFAGPAL